MSFRIEEKILVNKNQILDFQKFCLNISAKKLYETRIIKSLYLDNNNRDKRRMKGGWNPQFRKIRIKR